MPDGGIQTRIGITQEGLDIKLKWEVDDQLQLCFVQGDSKWQQIVTVSNISVDGKQAQFDIPIPAEITSGTFDLYEVHGGAGLSNTIGNEHIALLRTNIWSDASLTQIQDADLVMLKFEKKNIQVANPSLS